LSKQHIVDVADLLVVAADDIGALELRCEHLIGLLLGYHLTLGRGCRGRCRLCLIGRLRKRRAGQ
jgi:hypothetical protein